MRTAFIGLGVMGYPMAGHLLAAGHDVTVYNRTSSKADAWVSKHGGKACDTPAAAAADAEVVFCCVGNDDDVRAVMLGDDGIYAGLAAGGLVVDHTTASADVARELHAIASGKGLAFIDAPVSGGQAGAENGQLTIMIGGDEPDVDCARPVMQAYAKSITHIGPVGSGQLAKMVNQICIAGVVQGLSEALNFSERAGLDSAKVIEAISRGAAQSWQMENRWQTMINDEFEFGFAVDWMRKDLAMAIAEAEKNGAALEMTKLVDDFYRQVQEIGGNRWDTSSLIARLQN